MTKPPEDPLPAAIAELAETVRETAIKLCGEWTARAAFEAGHACGHFARSAPTEYRDRREYAEAIGLIAKTIRLSFPSESASPD